MFENILCYILFAPLCGTGRMKIIGQACKKDSASGFMFRFSKSTFPTIILRFQIYWSYNNNNRRTLNIYFYHLYNYYCQIIYTRDKIDSNMQTNYKKWQLRSTDTNNKAKSQIITIQYNNLNMIVCVLLMTTAGIEAGLYLNLPLVVCDITSHGLGDDFSLIQWNCQLMFRWQKKEDGV